jgi:hypothetical protein
MTAELHNWLTTDAAKGAQMQEGANNTVLQPAEGQVGLQLAPVDPPRRGHAFVANDSAGWSIADLQVILKWEAIHEALRPHGSTPLLYLGWPVALQASGPIAGAHPA